MKNKETITTLMIALDEMNASSRRLQSAIHSIEEVVAQQLQLAADLEQEEETE